MLLWENAKINRLGQKQVKQNPHPSRMYTSNKVLNSSFFTSSATFSPWSTGSAFPAGCFDAKNADAHCCKPQLSPTCCATFADTASPPSVQYASADAASLSS